MDASAQPAWPEPDSIAFHTPGAPRSEAAQISLAGATRGDHARPAAPRAPRAGGAFPRTVVWLPILLAICAGIGVAAWRLRVPTEEFIRSRAPQSEIEQSAKVNERADRPASDSAQSESGQRTVAAAPAETRQQTAQSQVRASTGASGAPSAGPASNAASSASSNSSAAAPTRATESAVAPVAQRSALLVQTSLSDQQNIDTHVGVTVWRLEASQRPGGSSQPAVRADVDIGAVGMRLSVVMEKNNDPTLRASHTMTFRFLANPDSKLPAVAEIGTPQVRNESTQAVDPLAGVQAKITDNIFIVALNGEQAFAARNLELIRTRGWFDFPLRLVDGRIAKITIEKGPPGDRAFEQAFEAWSK